MRHVVSLTHAQADCARVIAALTSFLGNSPSFEEIRVELCVSNRSRVHTLVQALIERGWIRHRLRAMTYTGAIIPRPARSLRLTNHPNMPSVFKGGFGQGLASGD